MDFTSNALRPILDPLVAFLLSHKDAVTALAGAAPILSTACSAIALFATLTAAIIATLTFLRAKKQLESTIVYTMQKDGRELISSIRDNYLVYEYIFSANLPSVIFSPNVTPVEPATEVTARSRIVTIFQYYSALYQQRRAKIISRRIWNIMRKEMAAFLKRPAVRSVWVSVAQDFDTSFQRFCASLI
jgi:hypothetical protein